MTIEYELTPDDYAAFAGYHHSQPAAAAGAQRRLRLGFTIAYLVIFLINLALGPTPGDFIWLILAVLWYALMPRFYRANVRRSVHRIAQQGLCRGSVGPHRLAIKTDGISDTTPHYEWTTYWSGVERVVRLPERVLVYVGPNAAFQVPRRAFSTEAAFDDCVRALRGGIMPVAVLPANAADTNPG